MKKNILLILLIFMLSGCFNYTEINDLELVNGIYMDYKDGNYTMIFNTDEDILSSGKSVSETFRNFEESLSKRAYYAHIKVLIISSNIINEHYDDVMNYILRNNEFRNNFYLVVSNNISNIKSAYIKNLISNNSDVITSPIFKKVLTTYLKDDEVILPFIENDKITGSIVKKKNNIKHFNLDETRLYKIIKNTNPNIVYKNLYIYHSKIKKLKNTLYISLDAELRENNNKDIKNKLEKDLEKLLNKDVILILDINRNGKILNEE